MSSDISVNEDFYFEGIFPRCSDEFANVTNEALPKPSTYIDNICTKIFYEAGVNNFNKMSRFKEQCIPLVEYLNNIKGKKDESYIKSSCIYFNYMLKYTLMQYNCLYQNTKEIYKKMENADKRNNLPDKCSSYIKNIDDNTFYKFYFLEWLYNYRIKFKEDSNECPYGSEYYNKYLILLQKCINDNSNSFCRALNELKQENFSIERVFECLQGSKHLYHSSRTVTGIGILLFSIAVIKFIMYKVKNIFNLKKEEHNKLLDSFEHAYNCLVYNKCQIAYNCV
ncbi:variable surface protein [Plasmodium gonderi]|uniref:Variable surface protein n=1 Tax=Plasmodium gonderi TaxID=77519 RepID=A0A1Y1JW23_PLAGO|nr:variable surface protein [Plasmodium gonderi]GAW84553.1 variable surface protein [Plasmodium gonderi]